MDVVGLHFGVSLAEASAYLQKRYPSARIETTFFKMPEAAKPGSYVDVPATLTAHIADSAKGLAEKVTVDMTLPPAPPVVWRVRVEDKVEAGIARSALMAALRQKYGPETFSTPVADGRISDMVWTMDARGRVVPRGSPQSVCAFAGTSAAFFGEMVKDTASVAANLPQWCVTSGFLVRASFPESQSAETIREYEIDMSDFPLAIGNGDGTAAAYRTALESWNKNAAAKPQP